MGLLSFVGNVYEHDTLDTRFTTPSSTPYQTVIDARNDPAPKKDAVNKARPRGQPSKWKTPEFCLYYFVFAVAVPYMFWVAYDVSRESDPRWPKIRRYLSPGWIPGRRIDVSDHQYYVFRSNLPYMATLLLFHPFLRSLWNRFYPTKGRADSGQSRLDQRASFDYAFAFLFLAILHGISALKVFTILFINYQVATKLPRKYVPAATWIFNICTLFANELCNGYHFRSIAYYISPPVMAVVGGQVQAVDSELMQLGGWLDGFRGLLVRWEVLFNITILRLVSFNLDYYWSLDRGKSSALEKKQLDPANLSERDRVSIPADVKDFSFRNYIGYAIYAPLYLAGPILTFNDYISQQKHRAASIETPRTIRYGIRFLLVLLAKEVILHFNYVGAIGRANPDWSSYTAAQLSLLSFFNLHIIWLKLLLPWRLFRLWSLIDGIDPPENMVRCVSNNFSTQLFWRAWHRSYNRWLIRYIYVPLGGSSFRNWRATLRSIVTYLLVFTFVALWHDIKLRLLIWGWLIVLFMLPEWTAGALFPQRKWENNPTAYRMICCAGSVANVLMMISANLVGFAVGLDGLQTIVHSIVHDWSGMFNILTTMSYEL
ncbi:MBOAT, membrane-bound O-acyltransferase family-domain-containing protein [Thelonectria olida]|uniref:MBOAT, membrane-bound O-acyltransferase family-domain-containing protein n=1 Tax=Thelonectria olida TaxID=1576542 RepID=A0A9P8WH75_9HYPO|nr:MBOAT, membrane-bound O-acyltransferase family-domain-containing protein [Thelonectria olida]